MQRRLIYAAAPFRTATLKTLTAFNFRWPSILFSLVWTTFLRTGYPAPLRHAPHASAKEITCPLPPLRRIRRCSFHPLCPLLPFTDLPALSLRLSPSIYLHNSISFSWIMFEKENPPPQDPRTNLNLLDYRKQIPAFVTNSTLKTINVSVLTLNLNSVERVVHQSSSKVLKDWDEYVK